MSQFVFFTLMINIAIIIAIFFKDGITYENEKCR
jgi:hypothetical protein